MPDTPRTGPTISRRLAMGGLGLGAAAAAGTLFGGTAAAAEPDDQIPVGTIAELRARNDSAPVPLYYVTDAGQQGLFEYQRRSTASDDTGLTLVTAGGARYRRMFTGTLRLSWFGAKADYNPRRGTGTPADDALRRAFAALGEFDVPTVIGRGSNRGLPTIEFEAGNYVFREPGHAPQWTTGLTGLHLLGQGMEQTNVYLDIPESEHGTDNHWLVNDGTDRANRGVVNTYGIDGMSFHGMTGTERFMLYGDTAGAGVAKYMYFTRCSWWDLKVGFDIIGNANSDHIRCIDCLIADASPDAVFLNSTNPQSQNHDFVSCHFTTSGKIFNFVSGGDLHVRGCQITTNDNGVFLNIDPGETGAIGIGNATYNLTDVNPEVRGNSRLLYVNAPEANVTFVNPRFVTGHAQYVKDWSAGTAYSPGDMIRAGNPEVTIVSKQQAFRCLAAHTASADTRPRTGARWRDYWEATYELQIDAGTVHIRGGMLSLNTLMRYGNDGYQVIDRPSLRITDGCRLVNPIADMVGFEALETVDNRASLPRVWVSGCHPYTGTATGAYANGPTDPVDVCLNATYGYAGGAAPVSRLVVTASPVAGQGLPARSDGDVTFKLPRGAHVIGARLVSAHLSNDQDYRLTNHDGSVTLLPTRASGRVDHNYPVDTETGRVFRFSSAAPGRVDGFLLVEWI